MEDYKMIKNVIITGATTGIGKATAIRFAKEGYRVIITSRSQERGQSFAEELTSQGYQAVSYQVDVVKADEVKELIEDVVKQYGTLDVLVNNSGIAGEYAFFSETSENNMREMVEVNLMGVYYGMRYAIQEMKKVGKGNIVNLASIAGLNGIEGAGEYGATKHAVVGMTKGAAVEHGPNGIRVNAVAPTAVMTDILQNAIDAGYPVEEDMLSKQPLKRIGQVEDIANAIYFLASDEAALITGVTLPVDAGFTAK